MHLCDHAPMNIAHFRATAAPLVTFGHRRGMAVCPCTVNDDSDMRRLIDLNVDALSTDVPDRACVMLTARQQQALQTRRDRRIATCITSPSLHATSVSESSSRADRDEYRCAKTWHQPALLP